jgi:hypothetical protein
MLREVTPWGGAFLQKVIVSEVVKKFPAFYETRSFITIFTKLYHWPLYEPDESTPQPLILRYILIASFHCFLQVFLHSLFLMRATCDNHLILLDRIIIIIIIIK